MKERCRCLNILMLKYTRYANTPCIFIETSTEATTTAITTTSSPGTNLQCLINHVNHWGIIKKK